MQGTNKNVICQQDDWNENQSYTEQIDIHMYTTQHTKISKLDHWLFFIVIIINTSNLTGDEMRLQGNHVMLFLEPFLFSSHVVVRVLLNCFILILYDQQDFFFCCC